MKYSHIYSVPANTFLLIERGILDNRTITDIRVGSYSVTLDETEADYSEEGRSANYKFFTIESDNKRTFKKSLGKLEKIARQGAQLTCAAKIDVLGQ